MSRRWLNWRTAFWIVVVAEVGGLAYVRLTDPQRHETAADACRVRCLPKAGAIEKTGDRPSHSWRGEDYSNYTCVCR